MSLAGAWGKDKDSSEVKREYERYRWAVLEWCLRNWKRLEANAAVDDFIEEAKREIASDTPLVQRILEGCSQHYENPEIIRLIMYCIDALTELELKRTNSTEGAEEIRIQRTLNLDTALKLFWMN